MQNKIVKNTGKLNYTMKRKLKNTLSLAIFLSS